MRIAVCGAGGFIGGHLVRRLLEDGHEVRAIDIKPYVAWYQLHAGAQNRSVNLKNHAACDMACEGREWVYDLAADMGGIGFIESHKWDCSTSVINSVFMLRSAAWAKCRRYFFSSSACVYPGYLQNHHDGISLREADAYPADCEDGYGWQKLYSERLCAAATEDLGLPTRVARYHNVYGPFGTYEGGREKAPAAICRKVIEAKLSGKHEIEVWGDGNQTRSFMWIDDCIEGTIKIMQSAHGEPLNLGSSELVSINKLITIVEEIADVKLKRLYDLDAPQGVRGRNSDNTLIKQVLDWEPTTSLREGMEATYRWIWDEMSHD